MAWNVTRLPEPQRTEALGELRSGLSADAFELLPALTAHAERWPEDKRLVAKVDLVQQPDGSFSILAASLSEQPDKRVA
jgi:hypothetical protein